MAAQNITPVIAPEDYDTFFSLIGSDRDFPAQYVIWSKRTQETIAGCRARGEAIQEVPVRPEEFVDWLRVSLYQRSLSALYLFAQFKADQTRDEALPEKEIPGARKRGFLRAGLSRAVHRR